MGGIISSGNAEDAANNATAAQSASAAADRQLGEDQLAFSKQQYADATPMRNAVTQAQLDLMNSQKAASDKQTQIADDYDTYNKTTFRPLEQQLVTGAQNYDTAGRRADAAGAARSDVEQAFGNAQTGEQQALRRAGVQVGSGRNAALMQDAALSKATAEAGATTGAVRNVEQQGYAREMDAANLGRGLPSAQATAQSVGTQAANSGVNAGNAAVASENSGVPVMNAGYSGAMQGAWGSGQLYGQAANTYNNIANADSQGLAMMGKAVGNYAGTTAGSQTISGWLSDETKKKGTGKKASTKTALDQINETPVEDGWSYDQSQPGVPADGGAPHIGPMAQKVRKTMGNNVAPGGTHISAPDMNGKLMAGMQELTKRVKSLEGNKRPATVH